MQEARILHKLKNPYILAIIDAGIHEGLPYLVMEYMAGGSLQEKLRQQAGQPLPFKEALTILSQLGAALHYAHQQNVVHRDLKPANILFTTQGEVRLADFGLSVILETAGTGNVGARGTPFYMAPEQFEGKLSTKSDQYALGCIAYEMLTGRKPFQMSSPTIEAIWYQHTKVPPAPLRQFNPALSPAIEQAVLTALTKDRNGRHRDVYAFLEALNTAAAVSPVMPTPLVTQLEPTRLAMMKQAKVYRKQGDKLRRQKKYEHALIAYEQALHIDPTHAVAAYNKGLVLYDLKRYEEALEAYDQALRVDPSNAEIHTSKSKVLTELKRYKEAVESYEQAVLLDSGNAEISMSWGKGLADLRKFLIPKETF